MSAGLINSAPKAFGCLPASLNKRKGTTLIETLVAAAILSVVVAGVVAGLKTGELFFPLSSAKIDLQAEVRGVIGRIVKDARQATVGHATGGIVNNSPSDSYIKFQQVQGFDAGTGQYVLSSDYVEYIYNGALNEITCNIIDGDGNTTRAWKAGRITQPPFYTRDSAGSEVALNGSDLNSSGRLIVVINSQKQVRGSLTILYSSRMEVKIRNE